MRIQLLSDMHLEFHRDRGRALVEAIPVVGDVLVLAGDIVTLRAFDEAREALHALAARFPHVIYVPGNHEFYRTAPSEAEAVLARLAAGQPNLHVLSPGTVELDGVRFVGATLWFPPTEDEPIYRMLINDFRAIGRFVPWVHDTHAAHLAFLEAEMRPGCVVVTHHLPHARSVDPRYASDPSNRFYLAADTRPLVETGTAVLWCHGHTHTPADYRVGRTRVVCNPVGYPGERVPPAELGRVFEVDA